MFKYKKQTSEGYTKSNTSALNNHDSERITTAVRHMLKMTSNAFEKKQGNKVYNQGNYAGYSEKKIQVSNCECKWPNTFTPTQTLSLASGLVETKLYNGINKDKVSQKKNV